MSGWISLHRKIRKSAVFNDLQLYRLWSICLTEASHKEHQVLVGKQQVTLQRGQFVTGRFDLHKMYNDGLKAKDFVSEKTVWRWLETLQKLENLTINSTNKFSIVTVVNWDNYQNFDQQNDQQMTNKRPTNDQQMTTNNNGNKGDNDNKGNKKPSSRKQKTFSEDDIEFKIASHLLEKIRSINPNVKKPDLQKWSDHVRLMMEQDKRTLDDIREIVRWLYSEPEGFWKTIILSTDNLRKKFDAINTKRLNSTSLSKPSGNYSTKGEKNKSALQKRMGEIRNESRGNIEITSGDV